MASSTSPWISDMSKCYTSLVYNLLIAVSGKNTETVTLIKSLTITRQKFCLPSAMARVGRVRLGHDASCDVFLAPGVPFDGWPVKGDRVQLSEQPDEIVARSGNASQEEWVSKASPQPVAMPRVLRSASSPFPGNFTYRPYAEDFKNGNFTLWRSFQPEHASSPGTIKWTQLVLDDNLQLVLNIDQLSCGDPESPTTSYFHYAFYEGTGRGQAAVPSYEAIVCGVIVESHGEWVSWTAGVNINCRLFASTRFYRLQEAEIAHERLPSLASLPFIAHPHLPLIDHPELSPLQPSRGLAPPPSLPTFLPANASHHSHVPRLDVTDPEDHARRYPRYNELSHRQRRIYQQDYTRYV